ncbi:MAG: hypothetical protein AAFO73_06530 [Pseudomonadota bacterium]
MAWLTHTRSSQIATSNTAPQKGVAHKVSAPRADPNHAKPTVAVPSPFEAAKALWARWVSRVAYRRERASIAVLLDAEDRLLADMGVTRDDVRHVLATKTHPSAALQDIARHRRRRMVV